MDERPSTPPPEHGDDIACNSETDAPEPSRVSPRGTLSKHAQNTGSVGVRAKKGMQDPNQGFATILSSKIEELEKGMGSAGLAQGERDTLKARKKQLREVIKFVADKANSPEDRMAFLQSKYSLVVSDLLKMDKQQMEQQLQLELATKERDKAQEGLRRTNMLRDKLEELCRQLQKENKEVLEEARRVRDDETAARASLQARFQAAITDVTTKMDAQAADRASQLSENDNLRTKLGDVLNQLETFNQLVSKKELETQLAQARLDQQAALCEALSRKNTLLEEANAQLLKAHQVASGELETLVESHRANAALAAANKELKDQLDTYYNKFNEFQSTLTKSNQMFDGLKKELDTSARLRVAVVRERDEQRRRAEAADQRVTALTEDRQALTTQVATLRAQVCAVEGVDAEEVRRIKGQKEVLENLCRTLTLQLKAAKQGGNDHHQGAEPAGLTGSSGGGAGAGAGIRAETGTQGGDGVGSSSSPRGSAGGVAAGAAVDGAEEEEAVVDAVGGEGVQQQGGRGVSGDGAAAAGGVKAAVFGGVLLPAEPPEEGGVAAGPVPSP